MLVGMVMMCLTLPCLAIDQYEERSLRDITLIDDDGERLSAFDAWAAAILASSDVPMQSGNWEYLESKDEMTGSVVGRFVVSYSDNIIHGWLSSGEMLLGVSCPNRVYLRANDLGLESDDDGVYGDYQSMRVRFDDDLIQSVNWYLWEDNNDGASLLQRNSPSFIRSMLTGEQLMIEVELYNVEGRKQVAHFNLRGFSEAYERCPE